MVMGSKDSGEFQRCSIKEERQRTYNVTLRHVRVTIVALEKQEVLGILSVCVSVALLNQHATPMHRIVWYLWPLRLYHILPHCLINYTIFGKKLLNIKVCFVFLYNFVGYVPHSNKN
jgi:hypothetical protein